jgi:hypothetical protein
MGECQLPGGLSRSKVYKSLAASAPFPALAAAGGKSVTSRLRELIQQLGEAIHESVIESEQIAGVVQDIRKHGFDVLLMLEATIGLNEVSKDAENAEGGAEGGEGGSSFTKNDVNFLRSLRISIEGEDEDETQAG